MLIGLKLDIGFANDEVCHRLYGRRDILVFLRELGFDAVETPVGPETQTDELREHIARCIGAGLKVSLHPYSEGTLANPLYFAPDENNPCRRMHQRFFTLAAEAARLAQYPTIVNIHGAAGTDKDPREFLVERTIAFFTWAGQWCRENAPQVGVTIELQISPNADEPRQRIGDKYEELLEIVNRLGQGSANGCGCEARRSEFRLQAGKTPPIRFSHSEAAQRTQTRVNAELQTDETSRMTALRKTAEQTAVGVCWDFGHAWWNTRRYGWPLYPPEALLPRIKHVHCHDVSGGEDHQPLVYGAVPWRDFLKLLHDHGFDGRVILEVPPTEFPKAGGLQSLIDSAHALTELRASLTRNM